MAIVRRFELALVRANKSKRSVKTRRKSASWDTSYLLELLQIKRALTRKSVPLFKIPERCFARPEKQVSGRRTPRRGWLYASHYREQNAYSAVNDAKMATN
jgi:hypothetical protein